MPEMIKSTDIDFSKAIVIDSTLIKTYRACQQKYNYFEMLHYVPKQRKAAPSFGIAMHEGLAGFRTAIKNNASYPDALELGQAILQQSYQKHMPPENQSEVMQDDRRSLTNAIRLYHGFCQHYAPLGYKYHHIEVPFALSLGHISVPMTDPRNGDYDIKDVIYVGIIDAIIEWNNIFYLNDLKSTAMNITESYLDGYKLDQGLIGYTIAARELLGIDTHHVLVHCFWVQSPPKTKGKPLDEYYHTKPLYYDDSQLEEWHRNTLQTVQEIETKKRDGTWVMDFSASCSRVWNGCDYKNVCSRPPSARQQLLDMDFRKALWTPLEDERLQSMED